MLRKQPKYTFIYNSDATDHDVFLRVINSVIEMLASTEDPAVVFVTRINNWFDHKWLDFEDTGADAVTIGATETTLPPFKPNRVLQTVRYEGDENGEVCSEVLSATEFESCVKDFEDDGLFIWYSSNTKANGQGALMVYLLKDGAAANWYASFMVKDGAWQIKQVKGMAKEFLENLLD